MAGSRARPTAQEVLAKSSKAGVSSDERAGSPLEAHLLLSIRAAGLPEPEQQYRFHVGRRWRIDFAWPAYPPLAVEVEGGAYRGPGHRSVGVFLRNIDKYNQLTLDGWRLLRFHSDQIKSGEAVEVIRRALGVQEV